MPELSALKKTLSTHVPIVMRLPRVNFPQIISKHLVTVLINAGGDNHKINCISDQCFELIAAGKTGLDGRKG